MYSFTKEQEKRIVNSIGNIVDDLHSLLNECELNSLELPIKHEKFDPDFHSDSLRYYYYEESWRLVIVNKHIYIAFNQAYTDLCKKTGVACKRFTEEDLQICFDFVKNYKEHREKVVEFISRSKSKSNEISRELNVSLDESESYIRKVREASIELDFPPSQNPYEIEITKEDGRTVGKIDCGERIIKIYTDGDFVLVDKTGDDSKQKKIGVRK